MVEPLNGQLAAALVSSGGAIIVAVITRREIRRRVGTPNGRGNLTEMAGVNADHLESIQATLGELVQGQVKMVNSQAGQDRRLAVLERDRPPWWAAWFPVAVGAALVLIRRRSR